MSIGLQGARRNEAERSFGEVVLPLVASCAFSAGFCLLFWDSRVEAEVPKLEALPRPHSRAAAQPSSRAGFWAQTGLRMLKPPTAPSRQSAQQLARTCVDLQESGRKEQEHILKQIRGLGAEVASPISFLEGGACGRFRSCRE